MAVCQSIFGIGLQSSVRPDSPLSFESECEWWFLEITNIDRLYWLLQMPFSLVNFRYTRLLEGVVLIEIFDKDEKKCAAT